MEEAPAPDAAPPSQGQEEPALLVEAAPEVVERMWWEPDQPSASPVAPTQQAVEQEASSSDSGPSRAQYRVKRRFGKSSS